ncbi:hypothetical protein LINGRAHAP2_LOCUS37467, partial [Linum grandiflorum]
MTTGRINQVAFPRSMRPPRSMPEHRAKEGAVVGNIPKGRANRRGQKSPWPFHFPHPRARATHGGQGLHRRCKSGTREPPHCPPHTLRGHAEKHAPQ